jgi:methionyl-tRNA formyltransferase
MNLGLLVSGNLGYIVLKYLNDNFKIEFVLTDSKSNTIIDFCVQNGIAYFIGNPRNGRALNFCSQKKIDVLVSVNYLFVIEKDLIKLPKDFAFNIHGSLLPKYRGRTPHVWAIINSETQTGITAHLIDEGCDTGDIIEQIEIEIDCEDTGADILNKFIDNYIKLLNTVLTKASLGNLTFRKQQNNLATYFGKRTPEDGKIDWNWQKERIYNWIRAQAHPYPGAFTFNNGNKIIIDRIKYTETGFTNEMANGLVISTSPFLVKTPNGVVELCQVRKYDFELVKDSILK